MKNRNIRFDDESILYIFVGVTYNLCIYMVKNLYISIHVPLLLCFLAISMSSCYTPDDLKNDADDPAFIEGGLVSYDGDNAVIPGQYIVLLKEEENGEIDLVPDSEGDRMKKSGNGALMGEDVAHILLYCSWETKFVFLETIMKIFLA